MFSLKNKIAVVTGASRGIGQGISVALAEAGADVVVSDILDCSSTVKKIKNLKRKCLDVKADVSSKEDVENLINETVKKFGKIDILVNNAGIFVTNPLEKVSEEEFEKTIDVNLKSVFLCSKAAVKKMKKGSSIINLSSIAGLAGYPQAAAYCASKGGIRLITKELAVELGPKGIRVNSIHPGLIKTKMTGEIIENKKVLNGFLAKTPMQRVGKPEDIAAGAVFLASDEASFITGEELVIDGGVMAGV